MKKFEKKVKETKLDSNYFSDDQKAPPKESIIKFSSNKVRAKPGASVPPAIKVLTSNESVNHIMDKTSALEKKQPADFTIKRQVKKTNTSSYFPFSSNGGLSDTNRTTKAKQTRAQR